MVGNSERYSLIYCYMLFLRMKKLGLIPFAGVSSLWLIGCRQVIHE